MKHFHQDVWFNLHCSMKVDEKTAKRHDNKKTAQRVKNAQANQTNKEQSATHHNVDVTSELYGGMRCDHAGIADVPKQGNNKIEPSGPRKTRSP